MALRGDDQVPNPPLSQKSEACRKAKVCLLSQTNLKKEEHARDFEDTGSWRRSGPNLSEHSTAHSFRRANLSQTNILKEV